MDGTSETHACFKDILRPHEVREQCSRDAPSLRFPCSKRKNGSTLLEPDVPYKEGFHANPFGSEETCWESLPRTRSTQRILKGKLGTEIESHFSSPS